MHHTALRLTLLAPTLAIAVAVAACGSSATSKTSTSTSAGGGTQSAGIAAATAFLAPYLQAPTQLQPTVPLPSKPAAGKTVIDLELSSPVTEAQDAGAAAAAKVLGWNFSAISVGETVTTAVSAFNAAIARHPSAIIFTAYPSSLFATQIAAAKAAGITLISSSTGDGPVLGVIGEIDGNAQVLQWGRMMGAYFAIHSNGTGHAALFNVNAFPLLNSFITGFQDSVSKYCTSCKVKVVNEQLSAIGTTSITDAVAAVRKDPSIKWLVFSVGDNSVGVSSALRTAGITGVSIIGESAGATNLAQLKSGGETAWTGFAATIEGWRIMDALARHFEGANVTPAFSAFLPTQVIDHASVGSVAVGPGGSYVGVSDYAQQFATLWHES